MRDSTAPDSSVQGCREVGAGGEVLFVPHACARCKAICFIYCRHKNRQIDTSRHLSDLYNVEISENLASLCFESISKGECHKSGVAGDEAKEVYYNNKSVLRRVHNSCKYCACFVIVVSQHIVDTRQMLYNT